MSAQTVSLSGRKNRAIAWARIKLAGSIVITTAGLILMLFTIFSLMGMASQIILGLPYEGPVLKIEGYRFDCTTWWGTTAHLLLNVFIFVWGWDFMKKGRAMCQSASS